MRLMLGAMLALAAMVVLPADAQQPQSQPNCTPGRDLITIPEIKRQDNGKLLGTVVLADEQRSLPGASTGSPCNWQPLRYFKGVAGVNPAPPWPTGGEPIPGPTLRARVGDVVQLLFLNQVNPANFPNTLDQAEQGKSDGCDTATATRLLPPAGRTAQIYPRTDAFPNCLHGSSTANIHFHGTHTTPSTTGDNVLLYIRPALRPPGGLQPTNDFVVKQFAEFMKSCDASGPPARWEQMPPDWQTRQRELLQQYDKTAPYKGVPGALPDSMKLWPRNDHQIRNHQWPQYSIGAFFHCFPLPAYDPAKVKMGQAPGTHWYHAHKHGSTALNVGNGMTGAFVIEGAYDDELRSFYKETPQHKGWGLQERVLVIQGLETALNLLSGTNLGGPPPLSVNGRLQPVITMKPGQVQMWRIVNGAARTFVQLVDQPQTTRPGPGRVLWRQIAQDGVQFSFKNYERIGTVNASINLAAANRADLLVRAPLADGDYAIQVVTSVSDLPAGASSPLLTVRVRRDVKQPVEPPMDFIEKEEDFPKFPTFLKDIDEPIVTKRLLAFDSKPFSDRGHVSKSLGKPTMPRHEINGKLYQDDHVDQTMILDTAEEWQISNKTINIAHPLHIHINPFQITEIFQPNSKEASDPNNPCYADPTRPETWKPCTPLTGPFVWWDTFAIPTARQEVLPCLKVEECEPATIRPYVTCMKFPVKVGNDTKFIQQCRVTIPGYFKFKSRFVDFTGMYVLHCHILAHEDRGMMELIQVVKKPVSPYKHH